MTATFRTWDLEQRRDFVQRFEATEKGSDERKVLYKEAGIPVDKNSTRVVQRMKEQVDSGQLGLPADAADARPKNGVERLKFSPEKKRELVIEWLKLAEGKSHRAPEVLKARKEFLEQHGLQGWMMTQWAAAFGLRPTTSKEPKYNGQTAKAWIEGAPDDGKRSKAKKGKPGKQGVVYADTKAKRARTRTIPLAKRQEYMRVYDSLPAKTGERRRYCESIGISMASMNYWMLNKRKGHVVRGYGGGVSKSKRNPERQPEQEPEEADFVGERTEMQLGTQPKKTAKQSYDKLLRQNLILKGLLKLAQEQGFDMEAILEFRK